VNTFNTSCQTYFSDYTKVYTDASVQTPVEELPFLLKANPSAMIALPPIISIISAESSAIYVVALRHFINHPSFSNILMVSDSLLALKAITTILLTKTHNSLSQPIHNLIQHIEHINNVIIFIFIGFLAIMVYPETK